LALFFSVGPVAAQDIGGRVVFYGRVEDATSELPIAGARLLAADSSITVLTDSVGEFAVPLFANGPHTVYVDQIAYLGEQFDLDAASVSRFLVLRLKPQPFELEELTVVAEAALSRLVRNIDSRARAYPHAMTSLDRTGLERFGSAPVFEVIRARAPSMRPCSRNSTHLCVPGRFVSFRNPNPQAGVLVCVDEQPSYFPIPELSNMSLESVALVEIFGRQAIRVYTVAWMLRQAERGRTNVFPEWMAC
jgi:hypothetical protein